jgi:hypothetical protein
VPKLESPEPVRLQLLLSLLKPVPKEWFEEAGETPPQPPVEPLECASYAELVEAWSDTRDVPGGKRGALVWSESIDVAFSLMLAVVASTKQIGAQLFLRVIGPPGSAKSTLCLALEANDKYCKAISMQTGFHSGQGGNSLWDEMDGKCCIINEGDMLVTATNRDATLSQMRDCWTGKVTAHYRNGVKYTKSGLRTPFIVAGTPTLRRLNRSAAGDRFLDIILDNKRSRLVSSDDELKLLRRVYRIEMEDGLEESDGQPESQQSPEKVIATRKTVGYIDYIREVLMKENYRKIHEPDWVIDSCIKLAKLVAHMRARPDEKDEEQETVVEMETRLICQFGRLARCLALVMNKPAIDAEVMRRVAKVAHDTSRGLTYKIARLLQEGSRDNSGIASKLGYTPQHTAPCVRILHCIGWIKADMAPLVSGAKGVRKGVYRLTPAAQVLMTRLRQLMNPNAKVPQS